jgi:hypothetical protein
MARPAGQLERTTLTVRGGVVRGAYTKTIERAVVSGTPNIRDALAWIAGAVGASSLSAQIAGITVIDLWDPTYRYHLELRNMRDAQILCTVRVMDSNGQDVDAQAEYDFSRDGLKEALAQVAGDFGSSALQSAILAL